jgi:hypothetical protein
MSTLLHPSLKQFQIAPHEKQKAIDLIKAEILKRQSSASSEPTIINITSCSSTKPKSQERTPTAQNILLQCFDLPVDKEESVPTPSFDKELVEYMALNDTIDTDGDVLLFWKQHEKSFPILASIVKAIYCIPASNTTVERLFSSANNTFSDRRTNLDTDKLNQLLFLNKNLLPLKELDPQQVIHAPEKRKLPQISMSSSASTSNNDDADDELETLFSSSSATKKLRVTDEDQCSDDEIIDKRGESIDESSEQE